MERVPDFVVFEIPYPVKDIIFCLVFKDVLLEHLVISMQLAELLRVSQESLLELKVLVFQLGDDYAIHLT